MSHPVCIPKAAPGCLEPAPASLSHSRCCSILQSPPSARSCPHTNPPRHSGRKICSASSAPWEKGEEQVSGGHRGGEGCTPQGDPAPHMCGTSQPSTVPYPATKGSSSSQHTSYCSIVPLSSRSRSCKLPQKMLLDSEDAHQSMALTSLVRCRCCHTTLPHFSPVLVASSSPFSSLSL